MNFPEAESYLLSLGNEVATMKLGLENIRLLLDALGRPEEKYFKIQVAGTNGKGSVCAFLEAIATAAGIPAGVYTSPHLVSVRERIRINGREISENDFAREAIDVRATAERLMSENILPRRPTFFEHVTAMALSYFARSGVRLAILETGLGGRFDAVTAASSEIKVITRIDLDHQEYLGGTVTKIAAEKAAIIRPGNTVIVGEQCSDALSVIENVCGEAAVEPRFASDIRTGRADDGRLCFDAAGKSVCVNQLGLKGRHQSENAKTAFLTALAMAERFPVSERQIAAGLETAVHPGRLEQIGRFLLDGAHNPSGAAAVRNFLLDESIRPAAIIFGAVSGKDVRNMLGAIAPLSGNLILTGFASPRAVPPSELASIAAEMFPEKRIETASDPADAIALAESIASDNSIILATGSLYLIGEIRKLLNN